ncbi:hypothetical protein DFH94DRAFT_845948 [Russula ochroleuca]|uniref:Uncharacterized protein n=1 Tax=Russula ochroleuca TaxID=152965 RepID=A0A9P5MTA8_9AGAM|nr:hypothetical protein DFH94DRAFT_845948 [Russula ochroleuca]
MITGHRSKHYTYLKEPVPGRCQCEISSPSRSPARSHVSKFPRQTGTGGVALHYHVPLFVRLFSAANRRGILAHHGTSRYAQLRLFEVPVPQCAVTPHPSTVVPEGAATAPTSVKPFHTFHLSRVHMVHARREQGASWAPSQPRTRTHAIRILPWQAVVYNWLVLSRLLLSLESLLSFQVGAARRRVLRVSFDHIPAFNESIIYERWRDVSGLSPRLLAHHSFSFNVAVTSQSEISLPLLSTQRRLTVDPPTLWPTRCMKALVSRTRTDPAYRGVFPKAQAAA